MGLPVLAAGLLTTFVLIVAGAVLRARLRFRDAFWEDLERLAYWVLLPALLVRAWQAPTSPGSRLAGQWR